MSNLALAKELIEHCNKAIDKAQSGKRFGDNPKYYEGRIAAFNEIKSKIEERTEV